MTFDKWLQSLPEADNREVVENPRLRELLWAAFFANTKPPVFTYTAGDVKAKQLAEAAARQSAL